MFSTKQPLTKLISDIVEAYERVETVTKFSIVFPIIYYLLSNKLSSVKFLLYKISTISIYEISRTAYTGLFQSQVL